ncbi:MAG: hypothetical protein ACK518_00630 [bacterium]
MSNSVVGSSKRTQKRLANVRADRHVESREGPSIDVNVGEEVRHLINNESASPAKRSLNFVDVMHLTTTVGAKEDAFEKTVRKM